MTWIMRGIAVLTLLALPEGWSQIPPSVAMAHILKLDQNNPPLDLVV